MEDFFFFLSRVAKITWRNHCFLAFAYKYCSIVSKSCLGRKLTIYQAQSKVPYVSSFLIDPSVLMHCAQPSDISVLWWQQVGFHLTAFESVHDFAWTLLRCSSLCFTYLMLPITQVSVQCYLLKKTWMMNFSETFIACIIIWNDLVYRLTYWFSASPETIHFQREGNLPNLFSLPSSTCRTVCSLCGTVSVYQIWYSSCSVGWLNEWSHQIFITIIWNIISLKIKKQGVREVK